MRLRITADPGYGGDVVKFAENDTLVFAIHRVWTLSPKQRRLERLASPNPADRVGITNGCVNVAPEVYDRLVSCCLNEPLQIR